MEPAVRVDAERLAMVLFELNWLLNRFEKGEKPWS